MLGNPEEIRRRLPKDEDPELTRIVCELLDECRKDLTEDGVVDAVASRLTADGNKDAKILGYAETIWLLCDATRLLKRGP